MKSSLHMTYIIRNMWHITHDMWHRSLQIRRIGRRKKHVKFFANLKLTKLNKVGQGSFCNELFDIKIIRIRKFFLNNCLCFIWSCCNNFCHLFIIFFIEVICLLIKNIILRIYLFYKQNFYSLQLCRSNSQLFPAAPCHKRHVSHLLTYLGTWLVLR